MRILIFEPKYVGHYLGFATWAANAFAERGHEVIFSVPVAAQGTPQAAVKLSTVDARVDLQYAIDVPQVYDCWKNARFESDALVRDVSRFRPELVVAPSGDFLVNGMLIHRPLRRALRKLAGADFIIHNLPQTYPTWGPRDSFWRWVDRLAVDFCRSVRLHAVDPYATLPSQRRWLSVMGTTVRPIPHPYERLARLGQRDARERLGLPQSTRMLGSIGDLTVRKGTDLLLRSFFALDDPNLTLALYGILSPEMRAIVAERSAWVEQGRIILRDEFVPDQVFTEALFAVDGLWVGYPRQIGISSLLLFAADTARPVLSSEFGSVGWMTREYGMGRTFQPDLAGATDALRWFAQGPAFVPDPTGAQRLLDYHSLANFGRHLTAGAASVSQIAG